MVLSIISAVLVGVLMSQRARVWLLLATVIGAMLATLTAGFVTGANIGGTFVYALMIGVAIQLGYALGLFGLAVALRAARSQIFTWVGIKSN